MQAWTQQVILAEPEDCDHKFNAWRMEDLPMLPDKMKFKVIKAEMVQ